MVKPEFGAPSGSCKLQVVCRERSISQLEHGCQHTKVHELKYCSKVFTQELLFPVPVTLM